jgi:DNA adenine methylase
MKYFGGKNRLGKQIAEVINSFSVQSYHEPFCGLYSVGRHVMAPKRSGADTHPDLIHLLQAIQTGWIGPYNITEAQYKELQIAPTSALRGFVGFGCSFGGKFFGGYARDKTGRNYATNAARSLIKLTPQIRNVTFFQQSYFDYVKGDALVYCDPPYKDTTGFSCGDFDPDIFWKWVRWLSQDTIVLVSEYTAPSDFEVIWEKLVRTDMNNACNQKLSRVEKLFKYPVF